MYVPERITAVTLVFLLSIVTVVDPTAKEFPLHSTLTIPPVFACSAVSYVTFSSSRVYWAMVCVSGVSVKAVGCTSLVV